MSTIARVAAAVLPQPIVRSATPTALPETSHTPASAPAAIVRVSSIAKELHGAHQAASELDIIGTEMPKHDPSETDPSGTAAEAGTSDASAGTDASAATQPRAADGAPPPSDGELDEEQEKQVAELRTRDREVRAHEAAHKAAAGGLGASAPSFDMETGPDGRQYAVGGEVNIDVSEGATPEETVAKAAQIRAAAHAPAQPSGQDLSVAAQASQMEAAARREIATSELESSDDGASPAATAAPNPEEEAARAERSQRPEGPPRGEAPRPGAPPPPEGDAATPPGRLDSPPPPGVTQRQGGVDGGHAHPEVGCTVCSTGIKAYGG